MRILSSITSFVWDEGNLDKNFKKHNVTIQEAEELFSSEPLTKMGNKYTTVNEVRFHALGHTKVNWNLFAAFTVRDNKIRVISIRDMSKEERKAYEKFKTNS